MDRRRFLKTAGLAAAAMPLWMTLTPEKLWSAIPSDIKITGVKVWPVTENNEVFVKVYTNKGVVGLGECSVHRKTITLANAVMDLERVIVGKDPTKIELLTKEGRNGKNVKKKKNKK